MSMHFHISRFSTHGDGGGLGFDSECSCIEPTWRIGAHDPHRPAKALQAEVPGLQTVEYIRLFWLHHIVILHDFSLWWLSYYGDYYLMVIIPLKTISQDSKLWPMPYTPVIINSFPNPSDSPTLWGRILRLPSMWGKRTSRASAETR